ncbi:MAG TPA: YfiR family protein [Verrucomicrobiae bacterium]|nr:YfiR family protein [Verrucomicrobiae bacterium]
MKNLKPRIQTPDATPRRWEFSRWKFPQRLAAGFTILFALWQFLSPVSCAAQDDSGQSLPEYEVKAAFLCNFAKFVEWPTNAFAEKNSPIIIGVFGDDPFDGYLAATAAKIGIINGHPLRVRKVTFTADLRNCHIVFISKSLKKADVPTLLNGLQGVLTVSDMPDFTANGGVIQFLQEAGHIRFAINAVAAKDAGLNISSKLLMLARKSPTGGIDAKPCFLCEMFL